MLRIGLETTNRCNLNCLHCVREKGLPVADLSVDILNNLIKEIKDFGLTLVSLTGGEPTMHPQFDSIIDILAKEDLSYTLVSNGWNFQKIYPVFLKNKKTVPRVINFSLDGAQEKTHDKMRGKGSYRKVMQAIAICRAKRIPFSTQMVVCEFNENEMEQMCLLASKIGCSSLGFAYPFLTPNLVKDDLIKGPDHRKHFLKEVMRLSSAFRLPIFTSAQLGTVTDKNNYLFECFHLMGNSINIDCRGNLTFCCNLSTYAGSSGDKSDIIGSLEKESFSSLYKKYLKVLFNFKQDRVNSIKNNKMSEMDNFGCMYCARYFHKLDWLKKFPKSPCANLLE